MKMGMTVFLTPLDHGTYSTTVRIMSLPVDKARGMLLNVFRQIVRLTTIINTDIMLGKR